MKYEVHITIEPPGPSTSDQEWIDWDAFVKSSAELGWKASVFEHDEVDGIAGKWFLSYASDNRDHIMAETQGMAHGLECSSLTVLRVKLEQTLFDTKDGDVVDNMVSTIVEREL